MLYRHLSVFRSPRDLVGVPRPVLTELIDAHHCLFSYRCCVRGALRRYVRRLVRPGADGANGRSGDDGRSPGCSGCDEIRGEIRDAVEHEFRHESELSGCGCECGDADGGPHCGLFDAERDNTLHVGYDACRSGHVAIALHDGGSDYDRCSDHDGSAVDAVLRGCCNTAGRRYYTVD